jgi:hypothetical protein
MTGEAGKGSRRRPGIIPPDAWNRIFHPDKCATCGELKVKCGCEVEVLKEIKEKQNEPG